MRALLLCLILTTGCASGMIRAEAIEGTLRRTLHRHQTYTKNNETLSDLQRRVDLRDGELLERVLDAALEKESQNE